MNIRRKADTPQLAQAIRDNAADLSSEALMNSIPKTDCYVLDSGSLLHRLPWKKGDSYNAIAESYVHDFESVGNKIVEDIIRKSAFTYKFKRKDRAKTLGNISAMKIAPDRTIYPARLFQRFPVVSRSGDFSLEEV